MRFMIIVKATKDSEAGVMPEEKLIAEMATYHEELAKAGALLDASGLQSSSKGWRIKYSGEKRTMVDGPFAETKELIAGYTLIQVKSREEALEWTKRFPNPAVDGKESEIEIRQLFELEDFGPSEAVERFREMGVGTGEVAAARRGRPNNPHKTAIIKRLPADCAVRVLRKHEVHAWSTDLSRCSHRGAAHRRQVDCPPEAGQPPERVLPLVNHF